MRRIGGNTTATIQKRVTSVNDIGEQVESWTDVMPLVGWLDYSGGQTTRGNDAKLPDTTHVFVCDHTTLPNGVDAETARLTCNGKAYEVLDIDNPMELNYQLEFQLRYTGGESNG